MNSVAANQERNSTAILSHSVYRRERTEPRVGDLLYLSLEDLRQFVCKNSGKFQGLILDYGCGGSPYKEQFAHCSRYVGADMLAGPEIDVVLTSDGKTDEPAGSYQGVVSFQVLEHVPNPGEYLDECYRVLSKEGLLLLTTHGIFLEHKCPGDYYRWTSQGLEQLVTAHGFTVLESVKLTTGLRGTLQVAHCLIEDCMNRRGTLGRFLLRAFRRVYRLILMPLTNICGKWYLQEEAITTGNSSANVYIGVGILARKSGSS